MKAYLQAVVAILVVVCGGCASHEENRRVLNKTPYHEPLISPGTQFGSLPPAAQNALRAETGSAEIENVAKRTINGRTVYEVHFQNEELYPPVLVAQDGSLLNPDLTVAVGAPRDSGEISTGAAAGGLKFEDLPPAAALVVRGHAPVSEIASIDREMWGNQIVYIVSFKDEVRYPKLYLSSDGTVLKEGHK
jgi:hypothetical protein